MPRDIAAERVCFVASPLTARSGVYRSARELVTEARRQGHNWSLVLGVSERARGAAPENDPEWISEVGMEPSGPRGVSVLRQMLSAHALVKDSAVLVSLIPQTDMALAGMKHDWVAYLRGLPWPDRGESPTPKRLLWRALELSALRRANAVWSTTEMLRRQAALRRDVHLVPAGIDPVARSWDGSGERGRVVWAARYDRDKNPGLFLDVMRGLPLEGVMYGSGPLEAELRASAPANVAVLGWADPSELWEGALAYVGTSHREAYGRSAVEAAMAGIPVLLADSFGCADLVVTDDAIRSRFVLDAAEPARWAAALTALAGDEALRRTVSDHVAQNGAKLTMGESVRAVHAALGRMPRG